MNELHSEFSNLFLVLKIMIMIMIIIIMKVNDLKKQAPKVDDVRRVSISIRDCLC